MKKTKKTLIIVAVCILAAIVIAIINKISPSDPFKSIKTGQYLTEDTVINTEYLDDYFIYFYSVKNADCQDIVEDMKLEIRQNSNNFVYNIDKSDKIKIIDDKGNNIELNKKDVTIPSVIKVKEGQIIKTYNGKKQVLQLYNNN